MNPHRILLPLLASLMLASPAWAQVIRSYESLDRDAGEAGYATLGFAFAGSVGNTDYTDFDLSGAVGYKGVSHWVRLYPSYHIRRSGGDTQEHERSAHIRHSYFFSNRTRTFAFVQIQADESTDIERRLLVGGGLRRRLVAATEGLTIDLGAGLMYENEHIQGGIEESVIRGTNLLVVNGSAGPVALTLTGYFQPLLDDWADHRVSATGSAAVPLGSRWALELRLRWHRDSRPPVNVEKDDAGLTVGARFAVR